MKSCVRCVSEHGQSDDNMNRRDEQSLQARCLKEVKDTNNSGSTSGNAEFIVYQEWFPSAAEGLLVKEPENVDFSNVDTIYLRGRNETLKFKKEVQVKKESNSRDFKESKKRTDHPHTPGGSIGCADSVDPARRTFIVHGSESALVVKAGGLWMRRGLLLKKWKRMENRIENGQLILGDKSYSLQNARLVPNSYGVDQNGETFLFTFKIRLGLKVITFGSYTYEQRQARILLMLSATTQN